MAFLANVSLKLRIQILSIVWHLLLVLILASSNLKSHKQSNAIRYLTHINCRISINRNSIACQLSNDVRQWIPFHLTYQIFQCFTSDLNIWFQILLLPKTDEIRSECFCKYSKSARLISDITVLPWRTYGKIFLLICFHIWSEEQNALDFILLLWKLLPIIIIKAKVI